MSESVGTPAGVVSDIESSGSEDLNFNELSSQDFQDKLDNLLKSQIDIEDLSPDLRSRVEEKELKDQSGLIEFDPSLLPDSLFDSGSSESEGSKVKHEMFKNRKHLLQSLVSEDKIKTEFKDAESLLNDRYDLNPRSLLSNVLNNDDSYLPTEIYNRLILRSPGLVDSNSDIWVSEFEDYLEDSEDSFVNVPIPFMFDSRTQYGFHDVNIFKNKTTRFDSEYKNKKLGEVMKLKDVIDAFKNNNKEFFRNHTYEACQEIKKLLDKPTLFFTVTMGRDSPAETFAKYKDATRYGIKGQSSWNHFWTNLKRKVKTKLGWDFDNYIKGVEVTDDFRLHIHIVVLGVSPNSDHQVKRFKKDILESSLNASNFGYINDVQLLKDDYNLIFKTDSDLSDYKDSLKEDNRSIQSFIESFKVPYDGDKKATMNFLKVDPVKNKDAWDKTTTYALKYALNQDSYKDVRDSEDLDSWLQKNMLFWAYNIKRFFLSKNLTSLLSELDPSSDRFYSFNGSYDFLAFAYNFFNNIDGLDIDKFYSMLRDHSDQFDAYALNESEDSEVIDSIKDRPNLKEFYKSDEFDPDLSSQDLSSLIRSPILSDLKFNSYISRSEILGLIRYELFKHVLTRKYKNFFDPPSDPPNLSSDP